MIDPKTPASSSQRTTPARPATWPTGAPPAFHVMAKPSGAICNLDCAYCYFLSKDLLYPGDRFRMADEVLETYIRQLVESHRTPEVTIAFQGGEPTLLGVPFFRRAIEYARAAAGPGRTIEFTMQTNGTLLDDEWCELFAEHRFLVGLSMDGPPSMHDVYRVDKRSRPTHDRVRAAWDLLAKHGVDTNILCTVHAANADKPLEVYQYFRDVIGARFIQVIPIVERATPETIGDITDGWGTGRADRPLYLQEGDLVTERSVRPEQWGRFLITIFDEWVRRDVGTVFVPIFDAALAAWLGIEPTMCIFKERCGTALALEHNGDLYSCDHFVEPKYLLGNIMQNHMIELVSSPAQRAFGDAKANLPEYCRRCDVRFACNGECPRNRFGVTPDGEQGLNYLCMGYKAFFHHIDGDMRTMADLLRRNRHADEIMSLIADRERT